MNRFICFLILSSIFGVVQASESVFQDSVLVRTLANSVTDFIYETEKDIDIKLYIDNSEITYSICADGVSIKKELFPENFNFIIYNQSNRNIDIIARPFKKYFKKGVYVLFPYQVLSGNTITVTIALRKLISGNDNITMTDQTVRISQYVYTLHEDDLSWHLTQKTHTSTP